MEQVARNLTDALDGFLRAKRFLIHDRDPVVTDAFRGLLASSSIRAVRLPPRSPNLNAYCERIVHSIKEVVDVTDIEQVVRKCWREIFEEQLHAWMRDPGVWPRRRSRDMFLEWFDVQVCEMVFDLGRGAIYSD